MPLKLEHHWRNYNSHPTSPQHPQARKVKQSSIHARHQAASGKVSSAFTWGLLLSNAYQFGSSNVWVLQHQYVHAFDMSTIIVFVYLGRQY